VLQCVNHEVKQAEAAMTFSFVPFPFNVKLVLFGNFVSACMMWHFGNITPFLLLVNLGLLITNALRSYLAKQKGTVWQAYF